MKTIGKLKQNSEEWHQWRKEGIGASEANIIMGKSSNISPLMLFNSKVHGIEIDNSGAEFIFAKGHRLEAKARPLFEMEVDGEFPDTIAVMEKTPFLRASLDGYSKELHACWECKFVGQEDFETVKSGKVLDHYYPQLQHQLMVTGANYNYLYVITDDKEKKEAGSKFPYKTAYVKVMPDMEYIENSLLPELVKFWKSCEGKKSPKMNHVDVLNLDDNDELIEMLEEYQLLKESERVLKENIDELQKNIYKIAKHTKNICNGVKITKSKSEDSIKPDYEKYCKSNSIAFDLDGDCMKTTKGRITKRITFPK